MVARCLTLAADALSEWWDASVAKQDADASAPRSRMDAHWEKGREYLDQLRFEVAQLDLLASAPVRQAAGDLLKAHQRERGLHGSASDSRAGAGLTYPASGRNRQGRGSRGTDCAA